MIRVGHVFDRAVGWSQRVAVSQLIDRLPREEFAQFLGAIDARAVDVLGSLPAKIELLSRSGWLNLPAGPAIRRFAERHRVDVLHAWGTTAAVGCSAVRYRLDPTGLSAAPTSTEANSMSQTGDDDTIRKVPLVVSLVDPGFGEREARLLRTIARPEGFAIACESGTVRRRLIERGLDDAACVLIRPGVDFAAINRTKRSGLRAALGFAEGDRVAIVHEPMTRHGGQSDASWAATLFGSGAEGLHCILPGDSREAQRIARRSAGQPSVAPPVRTNGKYPFELLLSVSDVPVLAAPGDIPTTAIAWAMASRTAIIGSAVPCVAEYIAHKVNGLLFKIAKDRSTVISIAKLLADRESQARCAAAAHGQAYEVFSIRRTIDQYASLYRNLFAGAPPGRGIADPAAIG